MNKQQKSHSILWLCIKVSIVLVLVSCFTSLSFSVYDRGEPLIALPEDNSAVDSPISVASKRTSHKIISSSNYIDASTLQGKVMCGYQGWFRAVGDGTVNKWIHWSIDPSRIAADTLTVEMWPDLADYPPSEKFPVPGMTHSDGSQAYLFSSVRPAVVDLHFKWMKEYGIDGVFVQRFISAIDGTDSLNLNGVLTYARTAANRYGRVFCITYDMSGANPEQLYEQLTSDWKFLVDRMQITKDKRYLYHNGKPVLMIYGFFPDRFDAATARKIVDFFRNDPKYGTTLIAGTMWHWRYLDEKESPEWVKVLRSFDAIVPWNVGNFEKSEKGETRANTNFFEDDIIESHKYNMMYVPVVYPGFSWDNLKRARNNGELNKNSLIPRRGGEFLWEQFYTVSKLKPDAVYVSMFDEVDEGTAIFKVTNNPPVKAYFVTYEGKPSDWYLRLTGYGTRMYRGEVPLQENMPDNF